jgi:polyadenylate-binding protein
MELRSAEQIEKAKEEGREEEVGLDGHPVGKLYVGRAQSKAERQAELQGKFPAASKPSAGVNLYVKNLAESTDNSALRALFEPHGKVTSAAAMKDDRGKCKGFGFVCFDSPD